MVHDPEKQGESEAQATPGETARSDDATYGLDEASDDRCPKCGRPMPHPDAVVCMHCGYDQLQNKVIKTKVGSVEVEENAGPKEFVRTGKLGWQTPAILGGAMIIAAAVLSGMHAPYKPISHGIATFLFAPVFAGIGVAAVWVTALLMEERFGRLEHAAGRMLLAVATVELAWHIAWNLELANPLRFLIGAGIGVGLYFLIVWWMFSLTRTVALMASLIHLTLWAIFMGLLKMNEWLAVAPAAS